MLYLFFGFCLVVVIGLLAFDLGILHRTEHVIGMREALAWVAVWVTLALLFNGVVYALYGHSFLGWNEVHPRQLDPATAVSGQDAAFEFLQGYLLELSLSMDNLFVFATILTFFRIPLILQHRVLVWGIIGAIILRGLMITAGVALVQAFDWIYYVFGVLLILTAVRMLMPGADEIQPERNIFIRLARKLYPTTHELHGNRFFHRIDGVLHMTPMFLALILVDVADVIFAVDSIPAIIGVTQDTFIVLTSNIAAVMGLRSMYFALVGLADRFKYVKPAIVLLLAYIGVKMLLHHSHPISNEVSLAIIACTLGAGVAASIFAGQKVQTDPEARLEPSDRQPEPE
jgi:tellurite resistance protein TerC